MNNLTKNELIALQHLSDGKQHDDTPKDITAAQYFTALKSLKARGFVYAAFIEGGEAECAQITMAGKAALDDYEQENQKQNVANGDVSNDARQRHIERMKSLTEDLSEKEYKVLEFLSHKDFTNEVPEGMFQPEYESVCDSLADKHLIKILSKNIDGYHVCAYLEGRRLVEYIKRNDTKFNYLFRNNNDVETLEESATMNITVGPYKIVKGKESQFVSVISVLYDLRFFEKEDGLYATNKDELVNAFLNKNKRVADVIYKTIENDTYMSIFQQMIDKAQENQAEKLHNSHKKKH